MTDVLDILIQHGCEPASSSDLKAEVAAHVKRLKGVQPGARQLVQDVEAAVQEQPEAFFTFDDTNNGMLLCGDHKWNAGIFETVSIAELRRRARGPQAARDSSGLRLFLLDGISPITDIASLQATCVTDTLFQVASQFNCLESVGDFVAPVASYFRDPTQGPRASISAFPATLLRHYRAPGDSERFVQSTHGKQINLLENACDRSYIRSGYLTGNGIEDPEQFLRQLSANFDKICVGVHDKVEVVFGYNWDGAVDASRAKPIAQIFTSTIAAGGYGGERLPLPIFRGVCQQLLRAAYLGTLLAAVTLGKRRVVLTLIGGGVFGNHFEDIWDAIVWAVQEVESLLMFNLDIFVNGYDIRSHVDIEQMVQADIVKHNGRIATFDDWGLIRIS